MGAELRSRVGDEFRAEAEAEERAVAALRVRQRSLTDVAVELMHRGDHVALSIGETTVTGRLTHVASDLATLATASGATLHVRLGTPIVISHHPGSRGGRGRSRDPMGYESFLAGLRALSLSRARVRIETPGPAQGITGLISAVAVDHVLFQAGNTEWFIPMDAVWGIWE